MEHITNDCSRVLNSVHYNAVSALLSNALCSSSCSNYILAPGGLAHPSMVTSKAYCKLFIMVFSYCRVSVVVHRTEW